MIEYPTNLRTAGACLTADPDLFFPVAVGTFADRETALARRICATCSVKRECLDFAMRTREPAGIWGGTTPEERFRALRARHLSPSPEPAREMPRTRVC